MYKTLTEVEKKKNELDAERQQNSDQMKLLLKVSQVSHHFLFFRQILH